MALDAKVPKVADCVEGSEKMSDWKEPLSKTDLRIDQVYRGGRNGNAGDDPMNALLGVSNQGGFRILGTKAEPRLVVLMTSLSDPEWPDFLDHEQGQFTYYGDNKTPGNALHGTARFGNSILQRCFEFAHGGSSTRAKLPPILAFANQGPGTYRDVRFLGLLVPGGEGIPRGEDLVAIWKSTNSTRFQNYRAIFSVLDIGTIQRSWLDALRENLPTGDLEPTILRQWRETGVAKPLKAPFSKRHRTKSEQLPTDRRHVAMLNAIRDEFSEAPTRFEACAARIVEFDLGQVVQINTTRASRDGGRDATGLFRIGGTKGGIELSFSVEAKCYKETNSVGVRELSRLISRLRHSEFGVFVTTSFVAEQAYQELVEDNHPVVVISGADVSRILDDNGLGNLADLRAWLRQF